MFRLQITVCRKREFIQSICKTFISGSIYIYPNSQNLLAYNIPSKWTFLWLYGTLSVFNGLVLTQRYKFWVLVPICYGFTI